MKDEVRQGPAPSLPLTSPNSPSVPPSSSALKKRRFLLILIGTLLGVALAAVLGGPHAWACYQLQSARSALARYHPEEAREHLANCLKVWPDSAEAHRLACRAAWQGEDFDEA